MNVKRYLETNAVFTIEEFKETFPTVTSYNLLTRATNSGKVSRVRRGLYVSNTGKYIEVKHNKFLIASKFAPDVIFAYHSALEILGVAHSISNMVQYFSSTNRKTIKFCGNEYKQYVSNNPMTQVARATAYGEITVTTKEQTLLDCLSYVDRGGGAEEVIRSLSSLPYIDVNFIKSHVQNINKSTVARVGWLLEQKKNDWNINEDDLSYLENCLIGKSYKFVTTVNDVSSWSKRWRLLLPTLENEIKEWLT